MKKELTLEVVDLEDTPDNAIIQLGGDRSNPLWDEYHENTHDIYKDHDLLIKEWVLKQDRIPTGEELNTKYFVFSDGVIVGFTWRGWGDFAQAVANKREGYMQYYMREEE